MTAEKFTRFVASIRPNSDAATAIWLEWANELEGYDSSHGEKPAGSYKTTEMFLDEFAEKISSIREQHGDEIAQKVIYLAECHACPFPWEMKLAAVHLAAGKSTQDIAEMEKLGILEDFSEDTQWDEGHTVKM